MQARVSAHSTSVGDLGHTPDLLGMQSLRYAPDRQVDVDSTLSVFRRGTGDPHIRTDRRGWFLALTTAAGPATVRIRQSGEGAEAWAVGPGADLALARVPDLLGEADAWPDLELSRYPVLARTLRENPGLRLPRSSSVFDSALPAVLEQRVTGFEAHFAQRYLARLLSEPAPGVAEGWAPERLRVPPSAEAIRLVPSWEWHAARVDAARSSTALRVAARATAVDRLASPDITAAEARDRLRSIPGVGVWTAAETTLRALGDPDAVSFGDYHLAHRVGFALTGHRTDDAGMRALLEPWRGNRARIIRLIELSGVQHPRMGPRMTVVDHRAR